MATNRVSAVWVFAALLVPAVLTSIVAILAEVLVERVLFEVNGGGIVSCSSGFSGITMSCTAWSWVWFAFGGVCAAAITARVLRIHLRRAGHENRVELGHADVAIAASGPFVVLLFANVPLTGIYLPVVLSNMTDLSYALQFFAGQAPYVLAACVGTAGFWAVLQLFRRGAPSSYVRLAA